MSHCTPSHDSGVYAGGIIGLFSRHWARVDWDHLNIVHHLCSMTSWVLTDILLGMPFHVYNANSMAKQTKLPKLLILDSILNVPAFIINIHAREDRPHSNRAWAMQWLRGTNLQVKIWFTWSDVSSHGTATNLLIYISKGRHQMRIQKLACEKT